MDPLKIIITTSTRTRPTTIICIRATRAITLCSMTFSEVTFIMAHFLVQTTVSSRIITIALRAPQLASSNNFTTDCITMPLRSKLNTITAARRTISNLIIQNIAPRKASKNVLQWVKSSGSTMLDAKRLKRVKLKRIAIS